MAKKSAVARNNKRARMAEQQAAKRAELRAKLKVPNLGYEEKQDVMFKLQSLPRNGSKVRVLNRILTWTKAGVRYEADPRHAEIVIKDLLLKA